ncbi:wax ester/triacylglycerol synthase family O-acyltransferase [Actinomycetospora lutea]|uniref:wax ester/triacylglycerol synthase domain-containing protein n=1 Tax=Actinomycetospora lutea TaxID=663604 RepID=UPI00236607B6|nr:wax ester/triacylglycerol synthase domain-containing protein [Actinomycetospora lutea]MDD7942851.1 wax ester/triacylglycerol synthase family O-acyltransferase [Actinomycetospora lutea]
MDPVRLRLDELMYAWLDYEDTPMQVALLGTFDGGPLVRPDGAVDVLRVRRELASRAHRVPALGRRVFWTRFGEGRPLWVTDPGFDPLDHIETTTLPPGADLPGWAANRATRPLDRNRPLWRAEVIDGLHHGLHDVRFAMLIVVSHILADGLTGVALTGALLDPAPGTSVTDAPTPTTMALPTHRDLVRRRLQEAGAALRRRGRHGRRPAEGPRPARPGLREARDAMTGFAGPEPATSLSRHIGPGRRLGVVRRSMEELRDTGHALDMTVNHLLLAAVTGGLRRLLAARGEATPGLVLRASVPAATGAAGAAGRQVAAMLIVELPVGEPGPLRRAALVRRATALGKARLRAAGGDFSDLHLPTPLSRWLLCSARRVGSSRLTVSVTDVPGPARPLWLAGARLLEVVPIAPMAPLVPLTVAALSYAGELAVTANADADMTDLDVLTDGIARSFTELVDLARSGARPPPVPARPLQRGRTVLEAAADIDRRAEQVFAYCTDPRNATAWNSAVDDVKLLTDGPIGAGTRYRFHTRAGSGVVQYRGFDPPRAWTATSSGVRLDACFEGEVVPLDGRSHVRLRAELRPHGALRLLAPVVRQALRRRWQRDLAVLRALVEQGPTPRANESRVLAQRSDRARPLRPRGPSSVRYGRAPAGEVPDLRVDRVRPALPARSWRARRPRRRGGGLPLLGPQSAGWAGSTRTGSRRYATVV